MIIVKNKNSIKEYCCTKGIKLNEFNESIEISNDVKDCTGLLEDCSKFNQVVIIPNSVTKCDRMFKGAKSFNRTLTIPNSVTSTLEMFNDCISQKRTIHYRASKINNYTNFNMTYNRLYNAFVNENEKYYSDSDSLTYAMKNDKLVVYHKDGVKNFCKDNFIGFIYFNYPVVIDESVTDIRGMLKDMCSFNKSIIIPKNVVYDDNFISSESKCVVYDSRK